MIDNDMEHTYHPLHDPVYMSSQMKQFFQHLLQDKLQGLLQKEEHSVYTAIEEPFQHPDIIDQSTTESLRSTHYAFHRHEKLLRHQIEVALQRLACGGYGYCRVTGESIGVKRLIAAPHVSYSLDVQEEQEEKQKLKTKMQ